MSAIFGDCSYAGMRFRHDHVLFRPYSPRGTTAAGLWLERNPQHPKIWGWLLAVSDQTRRENPALVPGSMLVVKRIQGEIVGYEEPPVRKYVGHQYAIVALPLEAIQLVIRPALVPMEAA